jgi:hypothetical protein
MKLTSLSFAFATTICATIAAHAASVVNETVNGVIAGRYTTDSAGYFGPAGTSLSGSRVTVRLRYVPADYNAQGGCAHGYPCKTYEAYGTPLVPQSVAVSVTINGRTVSFSPTVSSLINILQDGSDLFLIKEGLNKASEIG